jgi:hypothetical protein
MEHLRLGKPSTSQREHAFPGDAVCLAASSQSTPPVTNHSLPEHAETVNVPRYRVIVKVALHDRLEPVSRLRHRIVHALAKLQLDLSQFRSHALADRDASYSKPTLTILPADVREA